MEELNGRCNRWIVCKQGMVCKGREEEGANEGQLILVPFWWRRF